MLASAQLEFVEQLIDVFERQRDDMMPVLSAQAQYVAIVTMLRAIGQTFFKVDCDTPKKKEWAKQKWKVWADEPIFKNFIEPTRNNLLKQFRGLKDLSAGYTSQAAYADPGARREATVVVSFDATRLQDEAGDLILPKMHEAVTFWATRLAEARYEFGRFGR